MKISSGNPARYLDVGFPGSRTLRHMFKGSVNFLGANRALSDKHMKDQIRPGQLDTLQNQAPSAGRPCPFRARTKTEIIKVNVFIRAQEIHSATVEINKWSHLMRAVVKCPSLEHFKSNTVIFFIKKCYSSSRNQLHKVQKSLHYMAGKTVRRCSQ